MWSTVHSTNLVISQRLGGYHLIIRVKLDGAEPTQPACSEFSVLSVTTMQGILTFLDDIDIARKLLDFRKLLAELTLRIPADNPHADAGSILKKER